jgi:hypothetical protein
MITGNISRGFSVEISLNPKRIALTMLSIITVLAIMHITQLVIYFQVGNPEVFDFIEIIDFDYEANLPSFYSSTALMFCAVLLWVIGLHKRREQAAYKHHWIGLAIIFTFLSIDEAIALHEDIGDIMENMHWVDAKGLLYFAWVVPYGMLLVLFTVSYFKFVFSLPRQTMFLFIYAGGLFITGAIGIEVFSAREADLYGTDNISYSVLYTIEELCEMLGIVIFCYALLRYIEEQEGHVLFHIRHKAT